MAESKKSSRADKTASDSQKKKSSSGKKNVVERKTLSVKTEYDGSISPQALTAAISAIFFVLFLVIIINPEGALLKVIQSIVLGFIGKIGFYVSLPALLYLFEINTFGKRNSPKLRSTFVGLFVLFTGCIYHLCVQTQFTSEGLDVVKSLYSGGELGVTGGIICGGIAEMLRWLCGSFISFVILILAAIISLLGAFQITIPSIIRAIVNRPKDDWVEREKENRPEPAAVVVNHIVNKQIEHKREKRQKQEMIQAAQALPVSEPPAASQKRREPRKEELATSKPVRPPEKSVRPNVPEIGTGTPSKAAGVMNTIGLDIETPAVGGQRIPAVEPAVPVRVTPEPEEFEDKVPNNPSRMPELNMVDIPKFVRQQDLTGVKTAAGQPEKKVSAPAVEEKPGKVTAKDAAESAQVVAQEIAQGQGTEPGAYCFPPLELLKQPERGKADGTDEMRENSRRLNETLASFHIDAHIINVTRGPSVTRYEVELDRGVRLNKLTGCADDIALSLGASAVRIAAVPGKISVVGIEVPNSSVTMVSLREVIGSGEFEKAKSKSSFAVGKDIGGSCIVGNIAKMPHMLIAGTTGSGKSVCMNSIIISLLYKAGPEDVKLIMVDPKMVELGIYNGIPHLLIPVVTDPKKAAGSLQWAVTEMLRRYKQMSEVGVRDLESYNKIMLEQEKGQKLPQIIVIIDELADLMMVAAKEVEDSICRIAQMGRAAGMHLIIATQRPSADVITGLMKANIPSRIAFSVASAMESRIILDTQGAEKLVGKGDMLYSPIGSGKPLRVQGCFVTDGEVESVAGYVKANYVADYNQQVLEEIERKAQQTGKTKPGAAEVEASDEELGGDEMLPAAVDVILETGQASVSMLQRRLKLGYARAARIVDEMEEKGIVGPFQGSKPRSILVTKEQWEAKKNGCQQLDADFSEADAFSEDFE